MGAKTFEELRAWQCATELSDRVVAICETPALQRDFTFRNQLRDAARSAPRLIAEGFGRWGHREFARSEIFEGRNDLLALQRRETLPAEVVADLLTLSELTARTIARLRSSL